MTEPILFGFPLSLLFLYFVVYAFLGWVMETCYCSILEKRFVARGFLYGPLCPIYGVGVLMMICWFAPLIGNPLLFYAVAVVVMSAWEYLVGWFLEATTHIKYWDYSDRKFNFQGRICLGISLTWGVLAYLMIFWVHPAVAGVLGLLNPTVRHVLALAALVLLAADATLTIRELMLVSRAMTRLNEAGEELRLQLVLGRAELNDKLDEVKEAIGDKLEGFTDKLDDAKDAFSDKLDDAKESIAGKFAAAKSTTPAETAEKLREKYDVLLTKAEKASRHLRYSYSSMSSQKLSPSLSAVTEAARKRSAERKEKKAAKKSAKHQ